MSVHKPVFYRNWWIGQAGFWHRGYPQLILHCVIMEIESLKIRYFSLKLVPNWIWLTFCFFAMACQTLCCQFGSIVVAVRAHFVYNMFAMTQSVARLICNSFASSSATAYANPTTAIAELTSTVDMLSSETTAVIGLFMYRTTAACLQRCHSNENSDKLWPIFTSNY